MQRLDWTARRCRRDNDIRAAYGESGVLRRCKSKPMLRPDSTTTAGPCMLGILRASSDAMPVAPAPSTTVLVFIVYALIDLTLIKQDDIVEKVATHRERQLVV